MVKTAKAPKIPKGYEPMYTDYRVIAETHYSKPYKTPKISKQPTPKEYVQPVRIVNPRAIKKGRRK